MKPARPSRRSSRRLSRRAVGRLRAGFLRDVLPVVLSSLLLGALLTLSACGPTPGRAQLDQPAPEFSLESLAGSRVSTADLGGDRPVVLNFWATWCGPCVREIPTLSQIHRDGTAEVVSIALDVGGRDIVAPFVSENGIDYPVLLGDTGLLSRYGGAAIPYTVILDGDGIVRKVHQGLVSRRTLDRDVAAVREAQASPAS